MKSLETSVIRNIDADWEWSKGALDGYLDSNYAHGVIREDRMLSRMAISAFLEINNDTPILQRAHQALHIGIGNVPRGSALIAPLMADTNATITMGDIGKEKLQATQETIVQCRLGNLGIWQAHQDHMQECSPLWTNAFQRAAHIGEVANMDIHTIAPDSVDVLTTEHTPESLTEDLAEYRQIIHAMSRAITQGGILHMAYMVGSRGYTVGENRFPAYPVMPDEATMYVSASGLTVMHNSFTAASGNARDEVDAHDYLGMGVLVAQRL